MQYFYPRSLSGVEALDLVFREVSLAETLRRGGSGHGILAEEILRRLVSLSSFSLVFSPRLRKS
jgi:hypothetical protein